MYVSVRNFVCQEKLFLDRKKYKIYENLKGQKYPAFFVGVKYVSDA